MAHTEEDFSEASIDARFDVCLTTCTFAVNIRSGKADRKPMWLQQKCNYSAIDVVANDIFRR